MRIIGLTGGIASGKSMVAKVLEALGAVVLDADQISREAVTPGEPAYEAIVAEFGNSVLNPDGTINRGELGRIVFADSDARQRLEKITHPAIRRAADLKIERLRAQGADTVFYMAPLLIEAGAVSRVDEIWVVYADRDTQIRRMMERDRFSREEALQRIAAQMPMEEKCTYGAVVIDNRGSKQKTEQLVRELWKREIESRARKAGDVEVKA